MATPLVREKRVDSAGVRSACSQSLINTPIQTDMGMWKYLVSKTPQNLPTDNVKSRNEKALQTLLQPIEDMILPSGSDSDVSSGMVDVFEELHKDSFLRPLPGTKTKFLTKLEADRKTVDQFTSDFKSNMRELRVALNLDESLTTENEKDIEAVLQSEEKRIFFDAPKAATVEEPISVLSETIQSEATSNSAVWNMIKAYRGPYFYASPPHYDIYNVKPDHYLKRPHLSWKRVEQSREKCEKWLVNQCAAE